MPQASADQQGQQQSPQQHGDGHPGAKLGQQPHRRQQTGCAQPGQPPDHRSIDHGDVDGQAMQPTAEDQQGQHHQHHSGDQPSHPGGLQMMRQGWWLPGGAPSARRASDPRRAELDLLRSCPGWLVCGHVHDASQPGRRPAAQQPACRRRSAGSRPAPLLGDRCLGEDAIPVGQADAAPNEQVRRSAAQLRRQPRPIARAPPATNAPSASPRVPGPAGGGGVAITNKDLDSAGPLPLTEVGIDPVPPSMVRESSEADRGGCSTAAATAARGRRGDSAGSSGRPTSVRQA